MQKKGGKAHTMLPMKATDSSGLKKRKDGLHSATSEGDRAPQGFSRGISRETQNFHKNFDPNRSYIQVKGHYAVKIYQKTKNPISRDR